MGDTVNSLTDFDLCLSLAEIAIVSQFEQAWEIWSIARSKVTDEIEVVVTDNSDGEVTEVASLVANFAAPSLSLNVQDGKMSQVDVTLTIKSGTLMYWAGPKQKSVVVDGAKITFLADLDKKGCDIETLSRLDAITAEQARQVIENSGLANRVFSIEYLFLRLTDKDLRVAGNSSVELPENVSIGAVARDNFITCINKLLTDEVGDNLMLGVAVYPAREQEFRESLALGDFVFKVTPCEADPRASSLDYLGVLLGRNLPEDLTETRAKLVDPWFDPETVNGESATVSGVMAIKGDNLTALLAQHFAQVIESGLAVFENQIRCTGWDLTHNSSFSSEPQGKWQKFSFDVVTTLVNSAITDKTANFRRYFEMKMCPKTGFGRYSLEGTMKCTIEYKEYADLYDNYHVTCSRDDKFVTDVVLEESSDGTQFSLKPSLDPEELQITPGELVEKILDESVMQNLSDLVQLLFSEGSLNLVIKGESEKLANATNAWLNTTMKRAVVKLNEFAFFPPGQYVFAFQNPRFSSKQDLLLDVIYKQVEVSR